MEVNKKNLEFSVLVLSAEKFYETFHTPPHPKSISLFTMKKIKKK